MRSPNTCFSKWWVLTFFQSVIRPYLIPVKKSLLEKSTRQSNIKEQRCRKLLFKYSCELYDLLSSHYLAKFDGFSLIYGQITIDFINNILISAKSEIPRRYTWRVTISGQVDRCHYRFD